MTPGPPAYALANQCA